MGRHNHRNPVTVQASHCHGELSNYAETKAILDAMSRAFHWIGDLFGHGEPIDFKKVDKQPRK